MAAVNVGAVDSCGIRACSSSGLQQPIVAAVGYGCSRLWRPSILSAVNFGCVRAWDNR